MTYRSLALCSSKGAYEAIPDPKLRLDLREARSRLESVGRSVVDARVMLILPGSPEMTLTRDGKVMIKTSEKERADAAFRELATILALPLD